MQVPLPGTLAERAQPNILAWKRLSCREWFKKLVKAWVVGVGQTRSLQ